MLFNSYVFLAFFLPVALAGFGLACRFGRRAAMGWLLAASLAFYSWWNVAFLPVLLVSIAGNFAAARAILAAKEPGRRAILLTAIALNLAALGWYKYLGAVMAFAGIPFPAPALPLGISFFTFTQIGYLLDCHSGLETRRSPLEYALFVSFFPHLIAGPILNGREIMPEFASWRLTARNLSLGGGIFLIGLLKKTLLADPVSTLAIAGFASPDSLTLLPAWRAALAWSLQLYFDFSGYSDMAVGLARMFGVTFPFNFDQPYKADSVIAYWQRWHISLTRFLMSAIHTPLTLSLMRWRRRNGHRDGPRSPMGFATLMALPIAITIGLAGIWHGAGLTFVVFGLLHAAFLIANHAWRLWGKRALPAAVSVLMTYLAVLIGAIVFRAPSLSIAGSMFAGMIGLHGLVSAPDPRAATDAAWLAGLYAIVWFAPPTQRLVAPPAWQPTLYWAGALGTAATLGLLSIGGTGEFLYFQF